MRSGDPSPSWRWFDTLHSQQQGATPLLEDWGTRLTWDEGLVIATLACIRKLTADGLMPEATDHSGSGTVLCTGEVGLQVQGAWEITTEQPARAMGSIRSMLAQSLRWAEGGHVPTHLPAQRTAPYQELSPQDEYVEAAERAVFWLVPGLWAVKASFTASSTAALTVLTASMAGCALSRLRFRGRRAAGGGRRAAIFPQVPAAIAVIIFKQFSDALPKEHEESARLDGASSWGVYAKIIMPLSRPVVAAVSVSASYGQNLADIQASSILGALPVVLLFVFFQRRIIEGVAGSGLKG